LAKRKAVRKTASSGARKASARKRTAKKTSRKRTTARAAKRPAKVSLRAIREQLELGVTRLDALVGKVRDPEGTLANKRETLSRMAADLRSLCDAEMQSHCGPDMAI
jgi:hypothetical protein